MNFLVIFLFCLDVIRNVLKKQHVIIKFCWMFTGVSRHCTCWGCEIFTMSAGSDFEHFKRYLHYGMDAPLYLPGDRFFLKCYTKERCAFLNKLIEASPPDDIIGQIVKVWFIIMWLAPSPYTHTLQSPLLSHHSFLCTCVVRNTV